MAKARRPRPRRSRRGPFAPTPCEGSTAVNLNRNPLFPVPILRKKLTNHRNQLPSSAHAHGPSDEVGGPFFLCWPRPRPDKTNFPLRVCGVAAFFTCTRTGYPATRARDTVPLKEFQDTDPENGRHRSPAAMTLEPFLGTEKRPFPSSIAARERPETSERPHDDRVELRLSHLSVGDQLDRRTRRRSKRRRVPAIRCFEPSPVRLSDRARTHSAPSPASE